MNAVRSGIIEGLRTTSGKLPASQVTCRSTVIGMVQNPRKRGRMLANHGPARKTNWMARRVGSVFCQTGYFTWITLGEASEQRAG